MQINFGVVLDESMGDEVKITVIATGFERDNLPRIERRTAKTEALAAPAAAAEPSPWIDHPEPISEPVHAEATPPEPMQEELAPMAMAAGAMKSNGSPVDGDPAFDDLEVPAILRSRKRMVQ